METHFWFVVSKMNPIWRKHKTQTWQPCWKCSQGERVCLFHIRLLATGACEEKPQSNSQWHHQPSQGRWRYHNPNFTNDVTHDGFSNMNRMNSEVYRKTVSGNLQRNAFNMTGETSLCSKTLTQNTLLTLSLGDHPKFLCRNSDLRGHFLRFFLVRKMGITSYSLYSKASYVL